MFSSNWVLILATGKLERYVQRHIKNPIEQYGWQYIVFNQRWSARPGGNGRQARNSGCVFKTTAQTDTHAPF